MPSKESIDPVTVCERYLREELEYNEKNGIWPSVNLVISRFLTRQHELTSAYDRLHSDLSHYPNALRRFLDAVVGLPAIWGPDDIAAAQKASKRLEAVNAEIATLSSDLARLLCERSTLENDHSLDGRTHYHVIDVIEAAGSNNVLFEGWVRDRLSALQGEFLLKYWPSLHEVMDELGRDADQANVEFVDPIMKAATTTKRVSKAAFLRGLFTAIRKNSVEESGPIPSNYRPDDETVASLVNCALDLDDCDMVDAVYVKRFRQEERKASRH